jgi:hypothetical protein
LGLTVGDIDEDATLSGEEYGCSGKYSDELPECEADENGEHDWQSEYEVVGGCRENPGVWSNGGTSMSYVFCCAKCGCYKHKNDPGFQRNAGEALQTITIEDRDERSEAWIKETHAQDDWLPTWPAEYLHCSPTVRMTEEQAREWVAEHDDATISTRKKWSTPSRR